MDIRAFLPRPAASCFLSRVAAIINHRSARPAARAADRKGGDFYAHCYKRRFRRRPEKQRQFKAEYHYRGRQGRGADAARSRRSGRRGRRGGKGRLAGLHRYTHARGSDRRDKQRYPRVHIRLHAADGRDDGRRRQLRAECLRAGGLSGHRRPRRRAGQRRDAGGAHDAAQHRGRPRQIRAHHRGTAGGSVQKDR